MFRFLLSFKWVPNLFTIGNLLLGFYSVVITLSYQGNEQLMKLSGMFIIMAALLDGLDGLLARLLKASSEIGAQLDSLADLTTFGIAPGVLFYSLFLSDITVYAASFTIPLGLLLSGIFPAATAYRLARFNVYHSEDSFDGLPSPIAGLIIALFPFIVFDLEAPAGKIWFIIIFVLISYLMVSTIRYTKIQVSLFRKFSKVRAFLFIVFFIFFLVLIHWKFGINAVAMVLFILAMVYILSGILSFVIHFIQVKKL